MISERYDGGYDVWFDCFTDGDYLHVFKERIKKYDGDFGYYDGQWKWNDESVETISTFYTTKFGQNHSYVENYEEESMGYIPNKYIKYWSYEYGPNARGGGPNNEYVTWKNNWAKTPRTIYLKTEAMFMLSNYYYGSGIQEMSPDIEDLDDLLEWYEEDHDFYEGIGSGVGPDYRFMQLNSIGLRYRLSYYDSDSKTWVDPWFLGKNLSMSPMWLNWDNSPYWTIDAAPISSEEFERFKRLQDKMIEQYGISQDVKPCLNLFGNQYFYELDPYNSVGFGRLDKIQLDNLNSEGIGYPSGIFTTASTVFRFDFGKGHLSKDGLYRFEIGVGDNFKAPSSRCFDVYQNMARVVNETLIPSGDIYETEEGAFISDGTIYHVEVDYPGLNADNKPFADKCLVYFRVKNNPPFVKKNTAKLFQAIRSTGTGALSPYLVRNHETFAYSSGRKIYYSVDFYEVAGYYSGTSFGNMFPRVELLRIKTPSDTSRRYITSGNDSSIKRWVIYGGDISIRNLATNVELPIAYYENIDGGALDRASNKYDLFRITVDVTPYLTWGDGNFYDFAISLSDIAGNKMSDHSFFHDNGFAWAGYFFSNSHNIPNDGVSFIL